MKNDTHNRDNALRFESLVAEAVREGGMPLPGSSVVAALSGGADSVALTVALHRLGYRLTAVHCNYHLRGEESNRDARSVEQLCERFGIPLRRFDFDVDRRRATTRESVEMACRELRYDAFAEVMADTGAEAVAVGHHREDNIETFFLNLLRGSGLRGLAGMRPWDGSRRVMRPLLRLTRGDIERYLTDLSIGWVNDSSNASNDYKRNKLRNVVMPALREMFPDSEERICSSISMMRDNLALYDKMTRRLAESYVTARDERGEVTAVNVRALAAEGEEAATVLFELLAGRGFNMSRCRDIIRSASESGRRFMTTGGEWLLDRGTLRVIDCAGAGDDSHADNPCDTSGDTPCDTSGDAISDALRPVTVEEVEGPVMLPCPPDTICLDPSVLTAGTLSYRPWRNGDRIAPYGMKGTKKVSDILSNAKVPLDRKNEVELLVLTSPSTETAEVRETVLWVCGIRASRHFVVSPTALTHLKITYRRP